MRKVEKLSDLTRFVGKGSRVVDGDGIDIGMPAKPAPKPIEAAPIAAPEPDRVGPAMESLARTIAGIMAKGDATNENFGKLLSVLGQQKQAPAVVMPPVHGWEITPHHNAQGRIERITVIPLKK